MCCQSESLEKTLCIDPKPVTLSLCIQIYKNNKNNEMRCRENPMVQTHTHSPIICKELIPTVLLPAAGVNLAQPTLNAVDGEFVGRQP